MDWIFAVIFYLSVAQGWEYDQSEDSLPDDLYSYSEPITEERQTNTWRRFLLESKLNTMAALTTQTPEISGRRSMVVPTPAPPIAPDVSEIEEIRQRLQNKTLEDTLFQNNTHYKMAIAFTSSHVNDGPSRDLQTAICLMDCQIAQIAIKTSQLPGFRGKDAMKAHEDRLEQQWNNMTEIEKEFIEAVVASDETRRSKKKFGSMYPIFAEWCSRNCDTDDEKKRNRPKKKHRSTTMRTTTPEVDEDYESDEDSEDLRRNEKTERKGISLTVEVSMPQLFTSIFGETTVNSLSGPTLCLCGSQYEKICFCKSEKPNSRLITMKPVFT